MKVSREQMAANRERILQIAAALFRQRGFENVAVAEVMQLAGLTHGGFYGHFASKEALAAEAAAYALTQTSALWATNLEQGGPQALQAILEAYLSPRHRDHPDGGCAIAALGADVARQGAPVREAFGRETLHMIDVLASFMPGEDTATRRDKAAALLAQLVGAIVLSRVLGRSPASDTILNAARNAVGLPQATH
jgi:TetR/AcrR family transcriptional regulator, transcriptional repressor for nem operon